MVVEECVADNEVPGAGLHRIPSYSSERSDSDWTAVQSDGTITPPTTMSRTSSYKKDLFVCEDDKGCVPSFRTLQSATHHTTHNNSSTLTLQPSFDRRAMTPEPDLNLFPVKLVKKAVAPPDDDLAFIEQMLNGPQVFIPTDPFIYDGPLPTTPPPALQRRLMSVKNH